MIHLFRIQDVPVLAHWSVLAIAAFILIGNLRELPLAVVAGGSYLGVLAIHELGHALLARRMRCRVLSIKLYPIHGVCWYEDPGDERTNAVIAWGGVLAQLAVAVPLWIYLARFGYTPFPSANAAIAILGLLSTLWALLNLLPFSPFDGARAWSVLRRRPPQIQTSKGRAQRRRGLRVVR